MQFHGIAQVFSAVLNSIKAFSSRNDLQKSFCRLCITVSSQLCVILSLLLTYFHTVVINQEFLISHVGSYCTE